MIVLVFLNVLPAHRAASDLAWVTELAELLMVWVTFLGGACATRRGAQMTITEFIDKLPGRRRRLADARGRRVRARGAGAARRSTACGSSTAGWGNELTVLHIPMAFQYLGMPGRRRRDGRVDRVGPRAHRARRTRARSAGYA